MVELQLHLVKANKECTQKEICEKHQTKCVAGKMDCIIGIKQCELIRMEEWDRDKWLREIEGKTVAILYIGKINSFRRPVARLHRKMQVKRTHCKSWVFNLTDVDHLYVNHLFVMLLLRVFFLFILCVFFSLSSPSNCFCSRFSVNFCFYSVVLCFIFLCVQNGIVVIRIGCHFCSIRRNKCHHMQKNAPNWRTKCIKMEKQKTTIDLSVFVLKQNTCNQPNRVHNFR